MTVPATTFTHLLQEHLGLSTMPTMDDRLVDDLALDSLARLEIWVAFETMAGRMIDPGALDACTTVRDLYNFANQLLADRTSS